MARQSCISHAPKSAYLMIRQDFLDITDGDHCESVLLALFEYWTNGAMAKPSYAASEAEPWITLTVKEMQPWLFGLYGTKKIRESLQSLCARGYLIAAKGDQYEATSYQIQSPLINSALMSALPPWAKRDTANAPAVGEKGHDAVGKKGHDAVGENAHIEEEESSGGEEYEEEKNIPLPPSEESEQTNTEEQEEESSGFLYGDDAYSAVRRAFDREKKFKLTAGEKRALSDELANKTLAEWAIDLVVPQFVEWARSSTPRKSAVLITHGEWLKQMREPSQRSPRQDTPSSPRFPHSPTPTARAAAPPPSPCSGLPSLAEKWNTIVTAGPRVEAWCLGSPDDVNLRAALASEDFMKTIDKTLEVCQSIWQIGRSDCDYVTFSWWVKPGVSAGIRNGKYRYLLKPEHDPDAVIHGALRPPERAEGVIEKLER